METPQKRYVLGSDLRERWGIYAYNQHASIVVDALASGELTPLELKNENNGKIGVLIDGETQYLREFKARIAISAYGGNARPLYSPLPTLPSPEEKIRGLLSNPFSRPSAKEHTWEYFINMFMFFSVEDVLDFESKYRFTIHVDIPLLKEKTILSTSSNATEANHIAELKAQSNTKHLGKKERDSYLKLIVALLKLAKIDPAEHGAIAKLARKTEETPANRGNPLPISENTIKKILQEARELTA